MKHVVAILMFASLGALMTMLLFPPFPIYHTHRHEAIRGRYHTAADRHIDIEHEPIRGIPSPPTLHRFMRETRRDNDEDEYATEQTQYSED